MSGSLIDIDVYRKRYVDELGEIESRKNEIEIKLKLLDEIESECRQQKLPIERPGKQIDIATPKNGKPKPIAQLVYDILEKEGKPLRKKEIQVKIEEQGIKINYRTMNSTLSRTKYLIRKGKGLWGIPDWEPNFHKQ